MPSGNGLVHGMKVQCSPIQCHVMPCICNDRPCDIGICTVHATPCGVGRVKSMPCHIMPYDSGLLDATQCQASSCLPGDKALACYRARSAEASQRQGEQYRAGAAISSAGLLDRDPDAQHCLVGGGGAHAGHLCQVRCGIVALKLSMQGSGCPFP